MAGNRREESQRSRTFTRRAMLLASGQVGLFGVLGWRLYSLQVVERERYQMLAEDNRINLRVLPPIRGEIQDRFGTPIALNEPNYRVLMVPEDVPDIPETLSRLSQIVPISDAELEDLIADVRRQRPFVPVTVRQNLSWDQMSRVEVNAPDLPGLSIDVASRRVYPDGAPMSAVLGYVAGVSDREQGEDPLLKLPGFKIGKNGAEKQFEGVLRGAAGNSYVEVNAGGRVLREVRREPAIPGEDLQLTIDAELQRALHERLSQEKAAAAVVMDIETGDILAMGSWPSFDPNSFARGLTGEEWRRLTTDPLSPLSNRALTGTYAPGSTFKLAVALAGMKHGVSPSHTVFCPGYTRIGRSVFHCWKRGGHGRNNMRGALQRSCNVYFYDVARTVGVDAIAEMAMRLGLGQVTGIDLPNESNGTIPTAAWKQATFGEPWQKGEDLVTGVGQGFVTATPLQLATMAARVANGRVKVRPRILRAVLGRDGTPQVAAAVEAAAAKVEDATGDGGIGELIRAANAQAFEPLEIREAHLDVVRDGMDMVSNHRGGTAYRSRIKEEGMELAGKTGTSQVSRITPAMRAAGLLKQDQLPWRQRDHGLFVCFAPVHAPRYAAAVIVEHGGGGSKAAAPVGHDIMLACQLRDPGRQTNPLPLSELMPVEES